MLTNTYSVFLKKRLLFYSRLNLCLVLAFFVFGQSAWSRTCNELLSESSQQTHINTSVFDDHITYSTGTGVGKIVAMTINEFRQKGDTIPPETIVVLDQLPGETDPPFLAGIITSQPLSTRGSHVQEMFRAVEKPLVYIPNAYETLKAQSGKYFKITSSEPSILSSGGSLNLKGLNTFQLWLHRRKRVRRSLLPLSGNRRFIEIVPWQDAEKFPDFIVGQKFSPMGFLRGVLPKKNTPDFVALTTGYFESFKRHTIPDSLRAELKIKENYLHRNGYRFEEGRILPSKLSWWDNSGDTLQARIDYNMRLIRRSRDEDFIKKALAEIRLLIHKMPVSTETGLLNKAWEDLKDHFGDLDGLFSFRSSNDVEDYIGAGVYQSAFGPINDKEDFIKMLKSVWSSLYTYRAYQIRSHFGLDESKTSIAIKVHRMITNEALNGVSTFAPSLGLPIEVQAVRGSEERATNPGEGAQGIRLVFDESGEVENWQSDVSLNERNAFFKLFELMKKSSEAFREKHNREVALKFEWLFIKEDLNSEELTPIILQAKEALGIADRERVLYGDKEGDESNLNVRTDSELSNTSHFQWLSTLKNPMYPASDLIGTKLQERGIRTQLIFPFWAFKVNGEIQVAVFKNRDRPHYSTDGLAKEAARMAGGKVEFYGYIDLDLTRNIFGKVTRVTQIGISGSGGCSDSCYPNVESVAEAREYFKQLFLQMPEEALIHDPTISYNSLIRSVGGAYESQPDLPLSQFLDLYQ